ncbi:MAG: sigma-54 dependent transcriptional regulator, partial [Gemmatimonadota bacterium]
LLVLARGGIDLIVSDYRMPGNSGLDFLQQLKEHEHDVPLIMVTGHASIEHAVAAIKAGAIDYITKPFEAAQLELVVSQALEHARLRRENAVLRDEVTQLRTERNLVGESPALIKVMQVVKTIAATRVAVLVQGESGTGKELVAHMVHELSDRHDGPFVSINCAALPENLVESTLFGHEKGAFSGAIKQVKGAFERAHHGTLLLDEIGEMRLDLQAKLLRVLQEQEFERVGGSTPIRVDVRVVATTNRDLAGEAQRGVFREDLYYRLAVVPIRMPALRDRVDDIPALALHFARKVARDAGKPVPSFTPDAVSLLQRYNWPGNVRELSHAVERAVILSPGTMLTASAFDLHAHEMPAGTEPILTGPAPVELASFNLAEMEARLIDAAMAAAGGNRTRAATLLGIALRTLRSKLNKPI